MSVGFIGYSYTNYVGTNNDIKKDFDLKHKNNQIFRRTFNGSNSDVVSIDSNTIRIPNHFFVTGEEVIYSHSGLGSESIGIATTSVPGIGITDKLPSTLYIVKINDLDVKVSASATDALKPIPNTFTITSVGIGSTHVFTAKNQNKKVLITIDNLIQSPILSGLTTTNLTNNFLTYETELFVNNPTEFFGGDLIKINNEIMKIQSVGVGSTNSMFVSRSLLGTPLESHNSSDLVTKVFGDYNIVNNRIYFSDAPYGKVPFINVTERQDEIDYIGISTSSKFSGRVFLRSGIIGSGDEVYSKNYIFDDISQNFNGTSDSFDITSNGQNITGISTENAIILINSIFQGPNAANISGDYFLEENLGITSITFTGNPANNEYDINTAGIPRGGIILSVGSTQGFGYQPLISAGGTAVVSSAGTIQSISIGNSGSGYRSGIQSIIRVGVRTENIQSSKVEYVGVASANNGNIVSVAITNPGMGYTFSNPPFVVFDSPLSYTNIPLIYSSESSSGVGTQATIDVVVGQGSSIISFELKNLGYGYEKGEILTVSIGGTTGIPTTSSPQFSEFQISIFDVFYDKFRGWSIGNLKVIDPLDQFFDGIRKSFPIRIDGNQTTIRAKKGSNIDVQSTLLVFINDVLQVPGESYYFNGGSIIRFSEAPNPEDKSKILFYSGTTDVDTREENILETIKIGDAVTINSDDLDLDQEERSVVDIISSDVINTNLYAGPGITRNDNLLRPLTFCKQIEDVEINGVKVGKDRIHYEPYIYPATNIIQNVGSSSSIIFVDNVKTFFDSKREYVHNGTSEKPQNKIIIISQDSLVTAEATAVVSSSGTISSIIISNTGLGYTSSPEVYISNPTGIGTTNVKAQFSSSITNGSVSSVGIITGGYGYESNNPPIVLFESPSPKYEIIDDVQYEGDFGIITGIGTTSVGSATTGIVFDFFIPTDSPIRDLSLSEVGIASTGVSGIKTGYYFTISNSNIGNGLESLDSSGNIVGIGTSFIDNIYHVSEVSIAKTSVPGVGITDVAKVIVSVSDYNNLIGIGFSSFYGNYSWGRISTPIRLTPQDFTYNKTEIPSSPVVMRFNRLKYIGYSTT